MHLWRRIIRLWRANRHPLTDEELERALRRLRDEIGMRLAQARREVAGCAAEERRLTSRLYAEEQRATLMKMRARHALREGLEHLAWEAMREHLHAAKQERQLRALWQRQSAGTQRLQALLATLEGKFADIEHRRQQLHAYQQLMRAHQALVSAISDGEDEVLIEHAEEAIVTKEYIAQTYHELAEERLVPYQQEPCVTFTEQIRAALTLLRHELGLSPGTA